MSIILNQSRMRKYMGGLQNGLRGVPLILAFAAFGYFGLNASRAASLTATAEAESGSASGGVAAGDSVGASGGAAVRFGASSSTVSGWPGATSSGYKAAPDYPGSLTSCPSTVQSNQTYRFCNYSGGLGIGSAANKISNVTFYGCRFASNAIDDANVAVYGDNITFNYSTFEPSAVSTPPVAYNKGYQYGFDQRAAGQVTVDHSEFWGFGNGIQFNSSTQAKPFVVKNSWFHDARADGGGIDHTDGILSNEGGPSYMVFDHNRIASVGNTQGLALQTENQGYDHVTITNNYFSGFGYTVAIGENLKSTNITYTGNTFGTDFEPVFGPLYSDAIWSAANGNIWRNNKWHVVAGSYYKTSSDDGKFWLPSGNLSTTDYSQ